eukprot:TRINITY_DN3231_c0_g1_i6.p1 TRINITY_DN3231_c0_g1~~TRINITY_DN3231_c0_g1_i6.p1  ORF type:complete len:110 (+),score=36.38 TRINITY_DN3231_c0_g1_i6:32-331(+)
MGANTFVSLFFPLHQVVRQYYQEMLLIIQEQQQFLSQHRPDIVQDPAIARLAHGSTPPPPVNMVRPVINQGFIDPNDPSIIYVAQPKFSEEAQRYATGI